MRGVEGGGEEERLGGRSFSEDGTGADGDPGGGVEFVGERPRFGLPEIGGEPEAFEDGANAAGRGSGGAEGAVIVVVGEIGGAEEFALVADGFVRRVLVHVAADEDGRVTGVGEERGEGWVLDRHRRVADETAGGGVQSGEQGEARGDARRAGGIGAAKECAVAGEAVERGGPDDGVADGGEAIAAPLVGHEEEDVGARGSGGGGVGGERAGENAEEENREGQGA